MTPGTERQVLSISMIESLGRNVAADDSGIVRHDSARDSRTQFPATNFPSRGRKIRSATCKIGCIIICLSSNVLVEHCFPRPGLYRLWNVPESTIHGAVISRNEVLNCELEFEDSTNHRSQTAVCDEWINNNTCVIVMVIVCNQYFIIKVGFSNGMESGVVWEFALKISVCGETQDGRNEG